MRAENKVTVWLGVGMRKSYETPNMSVDLWEEDEDVLTLSTEVKDFNRNWLGFEE